MATIVSIALACGATVATTPQVVAAEGGQVAGATLSVSGEHDSFVFPGHQYVWTATLQWTPSSFSTNSTDVGAGYVTLSLAPGATLAEGVYVDNETYGALGPAINVGGMGAGCNTSTGVMIIDELEFDLNGVLQRLAARWEQHCEGADPASFGTLTYNATTPYQSREITPAVLDFGVGIDPASVAPPTVQTVDIINHGPSPLHITSVKIGGDPTLGFTASEFAVDRDPCSGITLGVGATCTVSVGFHPTTLGRNVAARLIIDDDVSALSGHGTGFDVRLDSIIWKEDGEFVAVTPARILDTRTGVGAPKGTLTPNLATNVQITGRGGVPSTGVSAVVLNVTAVGATVNSFVTLWATNGARPWVSNLNPTPGKVVANMATVPIGGDGKISMYNALGNVHLLFDVVGYYLAGGYFDSGPAPAPGSRYHAVDPFRMIDTRLGIGGVPAAKVAAGKTISFNVLDAIGANPSFHTTAIVMNVTATDPTATSYLTVYPNDSPRPNTSNLNFDAGVTVPNLVTVRVPPSGVVSFYNDAGNTNILVDVVGFYSDERRGEAGKYRSITPARAFDTRYFNDPLKDNEVGIFPVAGYDGIPANASSVVMNVTAVAPTGFGYLSVFPDDICTLPIVSNLNFVPGQTIPNMAIARLSLDRDCAVVAGAIDVYNAFGTTDVLIDVAGYFL